MVWGLTLSIFGQNRDAQGELVPTLELSWLLEVVEVELQFIVSM